MSSGWTEVSASIRATADGRCSTASTSGGRVWTSTLVWNVEVGEGQLVREPAGRPCPGRTPELLPLLLRAEDAPRPERDREEVREPPAGALGPPGSSDWTTTPLGCRSEATRQQRAGEPSHRPPAGRVHAQPVRPQPGRVHVSVLVQSVLCASLRSTPHLLFAVFSSEPGSWLCWRPGGAR